jgi:hypothetical protein
MKSDKFILNKYIYVYVYIIVICLRVADNDTSRLDLLEKLIPSSFL